MVKNKKLSENEIIKKEEEEGEEKPRPNGFERNKNNYPLLATIVGMFTFAIVWIIMTAK